MIPASAFASSEGGSFFAVLSAIAGAPAGGAAPGAGVPPVDCARASMAGSVVESPARPRVARKRRRPEMGGSDIAVLLWVAEPMERRAMLRPRGGRRHTGSPRLTLAGRSVVYSTGAAR